VAYVEQEGSSMTATSIAITQINRRLALLGRLVNLLVVVARSAGIDPREVLDEALEVLDRERARLVERRAL